MIMLIHICAAIGAVAVTYYAYLMGQRVGFELYEGNITYWHQRWTKLTTKCDEYEKALRTLKDDLYARQSVIDNLRGELNCTQTKLEDLTNVSVSVGQRDGTTGSPNAAE